jgi:biotin carboxyl carrier protein
MIDIDDNARSAITNARALLDAMVAGGWQQVCITGEDGDYFLARLPGTPNPLLAPVAVAQAQVQSVTVPTSSQTIKAPHVGTIVWLAAVGEVVETGKAVARLAVLDERIEIVAAGGGTVSAHAGQVGDLVEYAGELVTLVV